jgi:hypothetical protein
VLVLSWVQKEEEEEGLRLKKLRRNLVEWGVLVEGVRLKRPP